MVRADAERDRLRCTRLLSLPFDYAQDGRPPLQYADMGAEVADDREWIARSRAGDVGAFNRLVEIYQDRVYNLCLRMIGSPEGAEDAAQETFFAAFRKIGTLRGENFRAWLYRIASNTCLDELRRRRRKPQEPLSGGSSEDYGPREPVDPASLPESQIVQQELVEDIQRALRAIPADQRLAIILCDLEEMDYEQIARSMGSSIGTVKSRISRGRAKLRILLAERSANRPYQQA